MAPPLLPLEIVLCGLIAALPYAHAQGAANSTVEVTTVTVEPVPLTSAAALSTAQAANFTGAMSSDDCGSPLSCSCYSKVFAYLASEEAFESQSSNWVATATETFTETFTDASFYTFPTPSYYPSTYEYTLFSTPVWSSTFSTGSTYDYSAYQSFLDAEAAWSSSNPPVPFTTETETGTYSIVGSWGSDFLTTETDTKTLSAVLPSYTGFPYAPPCCFDCLIEWPEVRVFYWPVEGANTSCLTVTGVDGNGNNKRDLMTPLTTSAPSLGDGPVTAVVNGTTFTSPSAYLLISQISAYNSCGRVGAIHTDVVIPFAPGAMSTVEGRAGPTSIFNFKDLPCPPQSVRDGDWYNLMGQAYSAYNPFIGAPMASFYSLDPAWAASTCGSDIYEGYDPPYALQTAPAFAPASTTVVAIPIQTPPASPSYTSNDIPVVTPSTSMFQPPPASPWSPQSSSSAPAAADPAPADPSPADPAPPSQSSSSPADNPNPAPVGADPGTQSSTSAAAPADPTDNGGDPFDPSSPFAPQSSPGIQPSTSAAASVSPTQNGGIPFDPSHPFTPQSQPAPVGADPVAQSSVSAPLSQAPAAGSLPASSSKAPDIVGGLGGIINSLFGGTGNSPASAQATTTAVISSTDSISTQAVAPVEQVGIVSIGGETYTENSAGGFVMDGQTLAPSNAITMTVSGSAVVISEMPSGTAVVVGTGALATTLPVLSASVTGPTNATQSISLFLGKAAGMRELLERALVVGAVMMGTVMALL